MYHPACWIVFTATTALLFIPGSAKSFFFSRGAAREAAQRVGEPGGACRGGPGLHAHSARTPAGSELLCSRDCQALPAGLRARGWPPGWVPGPGSAATRSGGWLAAHGMHRPWLWGAGPLWLRVMGSCSFFPLPSWAPPVCLPPSRAIPRAPPASLLTAACKAGCQPASAPRSPLQSAYEAPAAAGTCRNLIWLCWRCRNLCELSRWLPKRGLVSTLLPSRPGRTRGRCWALERALAPR